MRRLLFALALAGMVPLAARAQPAPAAGPAVDLRHRFQPGAVHTYRLVLEQRLEVRTSLSPEEAQRFASRLAVDTRQTVRSAGSEGAVLELAFGAPEATMSLQGVQMPVAGLDGLARLKLTMRMTDRGRLSEVEALDAPELPPEVEGLAAELKKNLTRNAVVFPDRPVAPGESWTEERAVPAGLPGAEGLSMAVQATYTYRGMEKALGRSCARVDSQVVLGIRGRLTQCGLPVEADLKGRGQGQACFSLEEGRLVRTRAGLSVDGTLQASQGGQAVTTTLALEANLSQELK